jgi:hypothetical protein
VLLERVRNCAKEKRRDDTRRAQGIRRALAERIDRFVEVAS